MAGKPTDDIVRCSFCNKTQAQVRKLIAGPNGTYICDECIGICSEIIEEELDYKVQENVIIKTMDDVMAGVSGNIRGEKDNRILV